MTKHLQSIDHIYEALLSEMQEQKQKGKNVLAVFDLDSTLIEVGPRMTQIMRDFAKEKKHLGKYPKECRILERYQHHPQDYSIEHAIERHGLATSSFDFFKDLMRYWKAKFFSNDYLKFDEPLPGANHFLKELQEIGVHIAYLTARESKPMLAGTIESLKTLGFPLREKNKNLFLKETTEKGDAEFKRDVIKGLQKDYGSIWFFENEPINLRIVKETLPDIRLVYLDTVHSGKEEPPTELAVITHFKRKVYPAT
jgi:hypothetical protein